MKLANRNTGHTQIIDITLCCFTNYNIIYPMEPVYYCPVHTSKTISLGDLKFYVGFQNITSETIEHCVFVDPQCNYWRLPYQDQNSLGYLQI